MCEHIHDNIITLSTVYICTYLQLCTEGLDCAKPTHSGHDRPCHEVRCDGTVWSLDYPAQFAKFSRFCLPPPPHPPTACYISGEGGGPTQGTPGVMYCIWDNVRVKLAHLLFKCLTYVAGFLQSSLNSSLFLVGELFIHLDIFTIQTARPDSLYLGL